MINKNQRFIELWIVIEIFFFSNLILFLLDPKANEYYMSTRSFIMLHSIDVYIHKENDQIIIFFLSFHSHNILRFYFTLRACMYLFT